MNLREKQIEEAKDILINLKHRIDQEKKDISQLWLFAAIMNCIDIVVRILEKSDDKIQ